MNKLYITVCIPFEGTREEFTNLMCDSPIVEDDKINLAVWVKSGEHRLISAGLSIPIYGGKGRKREILDALFTQKGFNLK